MVSSSSSSVLCFIISCFLLHFSNCAGARQLTALVENQPALAMTYHKGALLTGPISVNLIWYGKFTAPQRAIITDFVTSLNAGEETQPAVSTWWKNIDMYYVKSNTKMPRLTLGNQILDESYSLGKSLTDSGIARLAAKGGQTHAINVVLTSDDVAVEGFCVGRCGTHRSESARFTYIWVGNSATQCPGQCAWPFHQPIYGPQTPPLVAPNGDVGVDGMVINLASLLAGTVTNPFGNGFYQGPKEAPLEAASACPGVYAKGAYPGYPGDLLVDRTNGASYNVNGAQGRKYLVPALLDPLTSTCSTII